MNSSFRLGSVLGITIRVHVLLLLLVGVLLFAVPDASMMALGIATLFGIVLLHELGHCIVARSFGIRVVDITLWPLGGMARMSEMPESSKIEGLIAVAGPIVNFMLAALAGIWLWSDTSAASTTAIVSRFLWMNLVMGTFNLMPAFPMDGGRVLRAILARNGDWVRATQIAVNVSRVFAVLICFAALVWPLMPLLAVWLWWIGSQELAAVRRRHAPNPLAAFAELARRAAQQQQAPPAAHASTHAADFGAELQTAPIAEGGARRLSDEEIARLEQYRGRLRHYRADQA